MKLGLTFADGPGNTLTVWMEWSAFQRLLLEYDRTVPVTFESVNGWIRDNYHDWEMELK